eukprot:5185654-Prymnesium_polylepis.1
MVKRTDGVKSGQRDRGVKASPWARCARWRLRPVRSPTWFQRSLQICKASIPSVQQPERISASSAGRVWRPPAGR